MMSRQRISIVVVIALLLAALVMMWSWRGGGGGSGGGATGAGTADTGGDGARGSTRIDVATVARGSIDGTVADPAGAPVAGARVCGYAYSDDIPEDEIRDPFCTTTGPDGRYRLADLLPARYELHAHAPRFAPGMYPAENQEGRDEKGVKLAAGESRTGIDIALAAGGVEVAGIVKDIGGGPVGGAWVYLKRGSGWGWGRGAAATLQSEADGTFRTWIAPGKVHATAEADGYARGEKDAIAPGQLIEILLTPESVLAGRVVEKQGGAPVPGARVQVGGSWSDGDGAAWGSAMTDQDGRFRLARLAPGRYKPTATARGRRGQAVESVLLGLGQTVEGIVIEVHPASVVTARVVLTDGKTPCTEGWVNLQDEKAGHQESDGIDADGKVEIEAAMPGHFEVQVRCTGYRSESDYPELVVEAGKDPPEQVWKVGAGAVLRGVVLAHDGRPVGAANVNVQPVIAEDAWSAWSWEETEADGTFEVKGLAGGRYKVSATPETEPGTDKPVEVEVPDQGEASVEIRLTQGGVIAGTVRDEDGVPVAQVQVRAQGKASMWRSNGGAQTLDDGSFRLEGLAPGPYRVIASRERYWGGELRAPGKTDDDQAGEKAEVRAGQTTTADLVVESLSGVIRGRVVDSNGAAITDAFVDAERESDSAAAEEGGARRSMRWGWARSPVLTDTDGGFAIEKLSPGTYMVRAFRKGGGEALVEHVKVGATVTVTIRETGSIAGTVVIEAGGAPDRMTVNVQDKKTGFRRREEFFRTEGAFAMRELPGGDYEVSVSSGEGTGKAEALLAEGQELRGLTITLAARARVTGRLITADDGKPLAGFMIQVMPVGPMEYSFDSTSSPPMSGADGRFEVPSAPAGKVQLMAFPLAMEDTEYAFARKLATLEGGRTTDLGDIKVMKLRQKVGEDAGDLGFELKGGMGEGNPEKDKLIVAIVRPDGPAAKAGLNVGDEIVSVDGQDVRGDPFQFWQLAFVPPGTTLTLGLERGATLSVTAGPPRT